MFEKMKIKEHMEIADSSGRHIGTVDDIEGDAIKLTKSDAADNQHHFIPVDQVEKVDDNRVYLKTGAAIPPGLSGAAL